MDYTNLSKDAVMMVWECDPKLRNLNNEVKLYFNSKKKLEVGDRIAGTGIDEGKVGYYEVEEIVDSRPGAVQGFNYVTTKTKFYR